MQRMRERWAPASADGHGECVSPAAATTAARRNVGHVHRGAHSQILAAEVTGQSQSVSQLARAPYTIYPSIRSPLWILYSGARTFTFTHGNLHLSARSFAASITHSMVAFCVSLFVVRRGGDGLGTSCAVEPN
jgi:hypothetical protein